MHYAADDRHVAHERLDDEVIVINLATGAYYSLRDSAADAWTLLAGGREPAAVAAALAERFASDEPEPAHVEALAAELVAEGLLVERPGPAAAAAVDLPPVSAPAPYRPPAIEKYDDMEELLLLDPIHEVDEAGWPNVAAEPA